MARNQEKANLMMNRWTSMKESMAREARGGDPREKGRRPYLASEVKDLGEAEYWRRDLVREITKKIAEIQNAGLGEARIRDLNDEINRLVRTKFHWEKQIKALGGPDYLAVGASVAEDGVAAPDGAGGRSYVYYGAARELPGVKEMFAAHAAEPARRSRAELLRGMTPDYYGYRDEEDGQLLAAERAREDAWVQEAVGEAEHARWRAAQAVHAGVKRSRALEEDADGASGVAADVVADAVVAGAAVEPVLRAHVELPSQQDIEAMLVERRKQLLLARYTASGTASDTPTV